ncbi:hypothetical protein ASG70_06465 [Phycicoccus sp. Soil748]|nr:hypothetical protein ASG70_06465 [Phycicoccus sp. Soil748]
MSRIWSRADGVAFVDDGERVIVLDLRNPWCTKPVLLSENASRVWRALGMDEAVSVERSLAAEPPRGHSSALPSDALAMTLEAMQAHGLVTRRQ